MQRSSADAGQGIGARQKTGLGRKRCPFTSSYSASHSYPGGVKPAINAGGRGYMLSEGPPEGGDGQDFPPAGAQGG